MKTETTPKRLATEARIALRRANLNFYLSGEFIVVEKTGRTLETKLPIVGGSISDTIFTSLLSLNGFDRFGNKKG